MIQITRVTQPEVGVIVVTHCAECKTTEITVDDFGERLSDADYWTGESQHILGNDLLRGHFTPMMRPAYADTVSK